MKLTSNLKIVLGSLLFVAAFIGILSLRSSNKPKFEANYSAQFDEYISAFTNGEISCKSEIVIEFTQDVGHLFVGELPKNTILFSPELEGKFKWEGMNRISFTPKETLPYNTAYSAQIDLRQFYDSIPDSLQFFHFEFRTRQQHVEFYNIRTVVNELNPVLNDIKGELVFNDFTEFEKIKPFLIAELNNIALNIEWRKISDSRFEFLIKDIKREEEDKEITLLFNGQKIGIENEVRDIVTIAAAGKFAILEVNLIQQPEQYLEVIYSDLLNKDQDLTGLIRLDGKTVQVVIDKNILRIYPKSYIIGQAELVIEKGIQNILKKPSKERYTETIIFEEIKPEVKFENKGTILPQGSVLPIQFSTVNLTAVDVRVIKIVQKNIPQFLQVNNLDGSDELHRVGQVLKTKTVKLDSNKNLKAWTKHTIDLSQLISPDPGAIYRISLGFKKSYSLYACGDDTSTTCNDMLELDYNWSSYEKEESSFWDYSEPQSYDYSERENPCKAAYYHTGRAAHKNILASSIGLIAKEDPDGDVMVIATDMRSAKPMSGVEIELYNYQQIPIGKKLTDADGKVSFEPKGKAFLVLATKGKEKGYLKIDGYRHLATSKFSVSGETSKKGIKGYFFGERGVWRPGDDIHLNFILEDKLKEIPNGLPLKLTFYNPNDQVVSSQVVQRKKNDFYYIPLKTSETDITGTYSAKIEIGALSFTKQLSVEAIVPNRLKIITDFPEQLQNSKNTEGKLEVKWLHGAIAANLDINVEAKFSSTSTKFDKYSDFEFDDPLKSFHPESQEIFYGKLDSEGKVNFPVELFIENEAPGMLNARFDIKAFEPGGNFSSDHFSVPFHPYPNYAGLKLPKGDKRGMLLTDTNHVVQIVLVDTDGKPLKESKEVEITLYKLNWEWWWNSSNNGDSYAYDGAENQNLLQRETIKVNNGKGTWKLRINYPDWGRYLVRVKSPDGHTTGKTVYIDWPGWAGRAREENAGGSHLLTLSSEKTTYEVGENVTINIPTPDEGRVLATIESGNKILETHWVETTGETTPFSFTAKPNMSPNIYVNIMLFQSHSQTKNDLPLRMYGIHPITIFDPLTVLKPVIEMNEVLEPMTSFNVKIKEESGKKMTYVVAVVDEGLLDLTRFKTPKIWEAFHKKQSLQINTYDLFDEVIGAVKFKDSDLLTLGGDEGLDNGGGSKVDRFKPVVIFEGPFELEAGQTKLHQFKMPNYVGSVRTMVIAANSGVNYGSSEKTTPVKKPLMVMGSAPRLLTPNDVIDLPVTVFAMDDKIKNVKVQLTTNNTMSVIGESTKNISFKAQGEQITNFKIKVGDVISQGKIKIIATSGSEKAIYEFDIDIRQPDVPMTIVDEVVIEAGATKTIEILPSGYKGTNSYSVETSVNPPMNLNSRLDYLIQYPHGCVEQTTSSVFPQLSLDNITVLSQNQKKQVSENVQNGIKRLQKFQTYDGGLAYWPGSSYSDKWGTNYASHFIVEAKNKGFVVDQSFLSRLLVAQKKYATTWNSNENQLEQAYRLFILALAGKPELGAMNRLRLHTSPDHLASLYLATAYYLSGNTTITKELKGIAKTGLFKTKNGYYTYGGDDRNEAIVLHLLSIMKYTDEASTYMKSIRERLNSKKYLSTQSTSYSLLGIMKYFESTGANSFAFEITENGKNRSIQSNKLLYKSETTNSDSKSTLTIKNTNTQKLYVRVAKKGVPKEMDMTEYARNLVLEVNYFNESKVKIEPTEIKQGEDFFVEIKVKNTSDGLIKNVALSSIFASGWEIHNSRMFDNSNYGSNFSYQDIRDDRVYTYFDIPKNTTHTYSFHLNATYGGEFYLPAWTVADMYDNENAARKKGSKVTVKR